MTNNLPVPVTKSPIQSLTVNGGALAMVGMAARWLLDGVSSQEEIDFLIQWGADTVTAAGIIMAIIGRFRATTKISFFSSKPKE